MNKEQLLKRIVANLTESLARLQKAARASHAEATHESSKAESKYDTRGLEAAYLAGGQARQAKELLDSISLYESLAVKDLQPDDPVELSALVELDSDGTRLLYFIGPSNGGLEITVGRKEVTVITPQSPLGQNLMGKKTGQQWTTRLGGSIVKYRIISVQ
ncbi:MAG TPA: GreA/GreB family elongation factor [Verrucomicrobiae bacterium]|nr:GreA/GreB family elongation factor [Verrucomicrobiae bacterium]